MLLLKGRYYRTIPIDKPCYETELLELDANKTALVVMHCWNIGCEDGPPIDVNYYIGMGFPEATKEAARIMKECIRPAMDVARKAGILVCHVECDAIAAKHKEARYDDEKIPQPGLPEPVVKGWQQKMADRFNGANYPTLSPYARMDRASIVAPQNGDLFVYQTGQMDRALRRKGIENLIYTGFCTDMCVLRAPGGIEPMFPRGYRIYLMRDATLGAECPDTFEQRQATNWAIRYFETRFGDTLSLKDFIKACEKLVR
jgi:nicotinamidase-related amidase